MSKRLNPFEKELLIKLFRKSKDISKREFCRANNVTLQTFNKWIEQYDSAGIEGLAAGSRLPDVLPEGINPTEEAYKKEILRLTLENELLKKNYAIRTTPDGKIQMQRLSPKNSK